MRDNDTYDQIGTVVLQTEHSVYAGGGGYLVKSQVRKDPSRVYAQEVTREAVQACRSVLAQGNETIADIASIVEIQGPGSLGFHYNYGHKLKFEVERALLVLAAQGAVQVEKAGRTYRFRPVAPRTHPTL